MWFSKNLTKKGEILRESLCFSHWNLASLQNETFKTTLLLFNSVFTKKIGTFTYNRRMLVTWILCYCLRGMLRATRIQARL